jgi:surface protein
VRCSREAVLNGLRPAVSSKRLPATITLARCMHRAVLRLRRQPLRTDARWRGGVAVCVRACACVHARACRHTDETLRAAVALWFDDNAAAVARYGPIGDWDTRDVRSMRELFRDRADFDEDIGRWNVGGVEDMNRMFRGAASFNQPLDKWDVSSVNDMRFMFDGAKKFNQPLDTWDVSSVKDMSCMFQDAASFNQPLDKWDVSSVKDMGFMFCGAKKFNQPLDTWDVRNVKTMNSTFENAASFDQPLDKWDVSSVTNKFRIFAGATSFKQPATRKHFGLVLCFPSRTHAVRPYRQSRMLTTAPPARTVAAQTRRGLHCCITLRAHGARQRRPTLRGRARLRTRAHESSGRRARAPPGCSARTPAVPGYSQHSRSTPVPSHGHCADRRRPAWRMQA